MITRHRVFWLALSIGYLALSPRVLAQQVHDFTAEELSPQKLIDALAPKEAPPVPTRGLTLIRPGCKRFHEAATRGLQIVAKFDTARIPLRFAFGSADLTPSDEENLGKVAEALNLAPLKPCCFEIQGHTDSVGGAAFNDELSQDRAEAVVDYLAEHGVEKDRMIPLGLGMSRPIASNGTAAGRAKNRRVLIVNLGYGGAE
jgi:outer membrane protein OmpA-like peptidoglycan-associated protein